VGNGAGGAHGMDFHAHFNLHGRFPEGLVNLLALSNNHDWDFGTAGVLATRAEVIRAGFAFAGSGADIVETSTAGLSGITPKVALVAAATGKIREGTAAGIGTTGVNEIRMQTPWQLEKADVDRNLAAINAARKEAAHVIAYLHNHQWGEDMTITQPWARSYARKCVDAGAVLFCQPWGPLLHGIEIYREKVLFHGLGSLVLQSRTEVGYYPKEVWESAIMHCDFKAGRLVRVQVVPVVLNETGDDPSRDLQTRGWPRLATGPQAEIILERLANMSKSFGASLSIEGSKALVNG
jgi:poly-gamma-glutamate capsule biosynthesis protein CapA/YwtB (metallophosphatase superfamily)